MKHLIYIFFIAAGVITIGTAVAATNFDAPDGVPVNVNNGDLVVNSGVFRLNDAGFVADRSDGVQTAFQLKNFGKQTSFIFNDVDDSHIYSMRFTQGAEAFELLDATNSRVDLSIETTNGYVGIGKQNPAEQLDVDGNIKLNGNITSTGDICIGNC